jgi:hypothetical protein
MGVFAGGFAENVVQVVVLLWSSCGEMCGKRGQLTARFHLLKIGHLFQLYFRLQPEG